MIRMIGRAVFVLAAMALGTSVSARAEDYPTKPITIIVPFGAGGITDTLARQMADKLKPILGQSVIVVDRPGQGGSLGPRYVVNAKPDGYTVGLIGSANTIGQTLYTNLPYDLLKDLEPVRGLVSIVNVLIVHPSVKANSVKDIIAMAKEKPGQIKFSSSGAGGIYHLDLELFKSISGVDILHVPYRRESGGRTAVIGGQVTGMFDAYGVVASSIKAGQLRALAVTSTERFSGLPNIPTMAEAGVPGYDGDAFLGLVAPKNTPKAILGRLNDAFSKVVNDPQFRTKLASQGMSVFNEQTPEEFGKFLKSQVDRWAKVIKYAHVTKH